MWPVVVIPVPCDLVRAEVDPVGVEYRVQERGIVGNGRCRLHILVAVAIVVAGHDRQVINLSDGTRVSQVRIVRRALHQCEWHPQLAVAAGVIYEPLIWLCTKPAEDGADGYRGVIRRRRRRKRNRAADAVIVRVVGRAWLAVRAQT